MSTDPQTPSATPAPANRRRRRKIILLAAGGVVAGLGLLVLLAPTLLSTGAGKSIVLSQVNKSLAGRVEVGSWSLGWFSGTSLSDIKVFDNQNRLAISVGKISTPLSLLSAARGNLNLGTVEIDSPNLVLAEFNADGTNNLASLVKPSSPSSTPKAAGGPTTPTTLPEVTGTLNITNLTGTLQGSAIGIPLRIDPSTINLSIPSLATQPITNTIDLHVRRDGSAPGTLNLTGTAQPIRNGKLDLDQLVASQTLTLTNLDLSALAPALATASVKLNLSGLANGKLDLNFSTTITSSAKGQLTLTNLTASGDLLKGDTFTTPLITIPIAVSYAETNTQKLLIVERVAFDSDVVTLNLSGALPVDALTNLAAQRAPGTSGQLTLTAAAPNLATLASQLKHTLALQDGVTLTSGAASLNTTLNLAPTSASLTGDVNIDNIRGTRAGKPITLDPVALNYNTTADFTGNAISGGNLSAVVTAGFANITLSGTPTALTYDANISLDRAKQSLSQFIDLGTLDFSGSLVSNGQITGDLLKPSPLTANISASITSLHAAGLLPQGPLNLDRLTTSLLATLDRSALTTPTIANVKSLVLTLGPDASPLLSVRATATADLVTTDVPAFDLSQLKISSLPELQRRFGAFVPALAEQALLLQSGSLITTASGSYVAGKLTLSSPAQINLTNLTVTRQSRPLLTNESLSITTAGTVATKPATNIDLSKLAITSSSNLLSLALTSPNLALTLNPDNSLAAAGALSYAADLGRLQDIASAYSGPTPTAAPSSSPTDKLSGQAAGTLTFAQSSASTTANGTLNLTSLSLGKLLSNESANLTFSAASPDQFKSLTATADIKSSFAVATIKDANLNLAAGPLAMVQSASIAARVDDLGKIDALLKSMSPPSPDAVNLQKGSLDLALTVKHDGIGTSLDISSLKAASLQLSRGTTTYQFPKDIDLKLAAIVVATGPGDRPLLDQIKTLGVTALDGSLGVATVKLTSPVLLTNLSAPVPSAAGGLELTGRLQTLTALLEVLQGKPVGSVYPYTGDYTLTQTFTAQGDQSTAKGSIRVDQFQLLDPNGALKFAEPRLEVTNDVALNLTAMDVMLKSLTVSAPSSNAINLSAAGTIKDLSKSGTISDPLKVKLSYDLARLVPLVTPMLSPDLQATLADATFTGKFDREITVTGAYPSSSTPEVALKSLSVTGSFAIADAQIPAYGLSLSNFEPAFTLDKGQLKLTAKPAVLNTGTLDVDGLLLDLTTPDPRLTIPPNKALLARVSLNKVLTQKLGKFVAVFANAEDASGRLSVTFTECRRLPLSALATSPDPANDSRVELTAGVTEFGLTGGLLGDFLSSTPIVKKLASGELSKAHVVLEKGIATQEVDLRLSVGQIRSDGAVRLADEKLMPITFYIGPAFIEGLFGKVKGLGAVAEIPVPINGTLSKPKWDYKGSVGTYLKKNALNFGDATKDLGENLGKNLGDLFKRNK